MSLPDRGRRPTRLAGFLAAAAILLPVGLALAAAPDDRPDLSAYVADGAVHAIAHAPGGNTYIGGDFSHVGPRSGHGLALSAVGAEAEGAPDPGWPALGAAEFPEVAGGEVRAVVGDGHGGWFIGGDFTSVAGEDVPRLAHVLPSGQLDASWAPAPDDGVLALALDRTTSPSDWTLYAGGRFTRIEASSDTRNYLAAWRVDGSTGLPAGGPGGEPPDEPLSWSPGQPFSKGGNWVHALAVTTVTVNVGPAPGTPTPTAVVVAGGDFGALGTSTAPPTRNRIGAVWGDGALKPDGTAVSGQALEWDPNAGTTAGSRVQALALGSPAANPAGTHTVVPVYFGGQFTSGGKVNLAASRLRVDSVTGVASANAYYGWDADPDGSVRTLWLSGGTLYAGGDFENLGPAAAPGARGHLAALDAVPDSVANLDAVCAEAACRANLRAWQPDPDGTVRAIAGSAGGQALYAGGDFDQVGAGAPEIRHGLAAVVAPGQTGPSGEPEGSALAWDARPAGGGVNALALDGEGLYAGGGFFSVGAEPRANLAALDPEGKLVAGFQADTGCDPEPCEAGVHALALAPDGLHLFAGGAFGLIGGVPRAHLAALDAATGAPVDGWSPDPDGWVLSLDVAGETLYAAGAFEHFAAPDPGDPQPARSRLAAIDGAGGPLLDWAPEPRRLGPGGPEAFNVYDVDAGCDTVYAGGGFNRIGATGGEEAQPIRNSIAALNPGTAAATPWNPNANSVVRALARDGEVVYAGGSFTAIGDSSVAGGRAVRHAVAALRAADGAATAWNPDADYLVRALAVSGDGETVYAGGSFTQIGGASRSRIAALEAAGVGDATTWDPSAFDPDVSATSSVRALATDGDNVYAGGAFTDVGARAQRGYSQFTAPPGPPPMEPQPGEPLTCDPPDTTAPQLEQPRVEDGGQTLVLALDEPAEVRVALTGELPPGLRPLRADVGTCVPDTPELRTRMRRQLRRRLARLRSRRRARRIRRIIAAHRCEREFAPREFELAAVPGENRIALDRPATLEPGSYRATVDAIDQGGNPAPRRTIDFEVSP